MVIKSSFFHFFAHHAVWIGLSLRIFLAWILPLLLDSGVLLPGVAYTDIDYHVFMDAASHIQRGESPYQRTTYRYTPFLAQLLALFPSQSSANRQLGRYLFCIADAVCGYMIAQYRTSSRRQQQLQQRQQPETHYTEKHIALADANHQQTYERLKDALWWLYNPLAINICTRGSAESFMVLFPVLVTIWLVKLWKDQPPSPSSFPSRSLLLAIFAGIWHGIAVHAKLYPIIYSLSYVIALSNLKPSIISTQQQNENKTNTNANTIVVWVLRLHQRVWQTWCAPLLTTAPIAFALAAAITFVGLTSLAVYWYGRESWDEGLLYHFSRIDHRHNYSMHWYWIYLARGAAATATVATTQPNSPQELIQELQQPMHMIVFQQLIPWVGRSLFIPQVILLLYSSFVLAPQDLALALFVQTFLFVTHNKVITGQYFTWYLSLLPLCTHQMMLSPGVQRAIALLLLSVMSWLGSAYLLEMQGWAVHRLVWLASLGFFLAQVHLLSQLLRSARMQRARHLGLDDFTRKKKKEI